MRELENSSIKGCLNFYRHRHRPEREGKTAIREERGSDTGLREGEGEEEVEKIKKS